MTTSSGCTPLVAAPIGVILNCSIEHDNKYSENAVAVFSSSKKMLGHILEPLAKILFPLRYILPLR